MQARPSHRSTYSTYLQQCSRFCSSWRALSLEPMSIFVHDGMETTCPPLLKHARRAIEI